MQEVFLDKTVLNKPVTFFGPTLFGNHYCHVTIRTDLELDGIYFKRIDLPGAPLLKATLDQVIQTPRTTILGNGEYKIILVEHLLAVLFAYGIKSAMIELDQEELPVGDGSALMIVEAIERAGYELGVRSWRNLNQKEYVMDARQTLLAFPSDQFSMDYILDYSNEPLLCQRAEFLFDLEKFKTEIAPCRTFAKKEEVDALRAHGLLKSNSLDHGIVIDGSSVLNPEGLRFENEMARHKILDLIGDLALADLDLSMHNVAIRSGHQMNIALAKRLKTSLEEKKER